MTGVEREALDAAIEAGCSASSVRDAIERAAVDRALTEVEAKIEATIDEPWRGTGAMRPMDQGRRNAARVVAGYRRVMMTDDD